MKKVVIEDGFDFEELRKMALCRFFESPRAMTLMQHTMLVDTTEVFCVDEQGNKVQIFVPKQKLYSAKSKKGAGFLFLRIALKEGEKASYWLVVYNEHRQGFLFPKNFITFDKRSLWKKVTDFLVCFLLASKTGRVVRCMQTFLV
jgi:hypothetical protein